MSRGALSFLLILVVGFVAWTLYSALGTRSVSCEVCVRFNGHDNCSAAVADDKDAAIRAATDGACALVTAGRNESIRCGAQAPLSVDCRDSR